MSININKASGANVANQNSQVKQDTKVPTFGERRMTFASTDIRAGNAAQLTNVLSKRFTLTPELELKLQNLLSGNVKPLNARTVVCS